MVSLACGRIVSARKGDLHKDIIISTAGRLVEVLGGNVPSCLSYAAADESGVLLAGGGVISMQLKCPGCSSRCMAVVEVFGWQDGLGLRCVFSPAMAYLRRHFRAFAEPSSRAAPLETLLQDHGTGPAATYLLT